LDDAEGCQKRGGQLLAAGDVGAALPWLTRACGHGSPLGCAQVASFTDRGVGGTAPDHKAAAPLFERAHQLAAARCPKDGAACYARGFLLETGGGIPADPSAAAEAYRLGCDAKYAEACAKYAALILVTNDTERILDAFHQGCQLEDATACA